MEVAIIPARRLLDKKHADFFVHHAQAAGGLVVAGVSFVLARGDVGAQIEFANHVGFETQRPAPLAVLAEGDGFFRHGFAIERENQPPVFALQSLRPHAHVHEQFILEKRRGRRIHSDNDYIARRSDADAIKINRHARVAQSLRHHAR